ncbi:phage major capsid protein, HK97 family [Sphingomonas guangdongensis]|uniref:Phage major capsid protein, HK97 family n=1 Tax=Sphingomonas guangdongensis TaxID=1141890 RepID=A0A285R341_9SPHN|nr:phage major capsid protein [Sphingomonas guangdongensis]SOB86762.1 phage major capsid protein, HK97 family [Sphingomonas guangdongensis]
MSDNLIDKLNTLANEFKSALERNDEAATERLNTAISTLEAKMRADEADANRVTTNGSAADEAEVKGFRDFLITREVKAMSATVNPTTDGGVTIPKVIAADIRKYVTDRSVMRKLAQVLTVTTPDFHIPVQTGGAGAEWVGETTRNTTGTPTIEKVVPPIGEISARALITQQLLEDSQFDLQPFLVASLGDKFDEATGTAFVLGDGTNKPKGLFTYATAATTDKAGTRPFGTFQHVASGVSGGLGDLDKLIDLVHSLKAGHRANASFVMSKATLGDYRKLKDSNGQYIWQPSTQAGLPSTLLGYPVFEDENVAEKGTANGLAAAFGDFRAAYTIVDRVSMTTLVNPYSFDPFIAISARARVGGCATDTTALKFLKLSVS